MRNSFKYLKNILKHNNVKRGVEGEMSKKDAEQAEAKQSKAKKRKTKKLS